MTEPALWWARSVVAEAIATLFWVPVIVAYVALDAVREVRGWL